MGILSSCLFEANGCRRPLSVGAGGRRVLAGGYKRPLTNTSGTFLVSLMFAVEFPYPH